MSETDSTTRFDLSLDAEANEIETIKVEIKGRVVELPRDPQDWPHEALEMLSEQPTPNISGALDILLEDRPEDRAAFRRLSPRKLEALVTHLAKVSGVTPGEARGSVA